jgi:flagellar motor component MotA
MHDVPLLIKSIAILGYAIVAIIMQSVNIAINVIPPAIINITWGGLVAFFAWFVISVYQDYKSFKKEVYPSISKINERLAVVENKLEIKR